MSHRVFASAGPPTARGGAHDGRRAQRTAPASTRGAASPRQQRVEPRQALPHLPVPRRRGTRVARAESRKELPQRRFSLGRARRLGGPRAAAACRRTAAAAAPAELPCKLPPAAGVPARRRGLET
jgi:hypothetical protein